MTKPKVQIISNQLLDNFNEDWLFNSEISSPRSLDEFEITIIDLSNESLWENNDPHHDSVNNISDLFHISRMIEYSNRTIIVFILPQNVEFKFNFSEKLKKYTRSIEFKNISHDYIFGHVGPILDFDKIKTEIVFENTITIVNDENYKASFYFIGNNKAITKSNLSNKATTIMCDDNIYTTLEINTSSKLKSFLTEIGLLNKREKAPSWFKKINMYNDEELKNIISEQEKIIDNSKQVIKETNINLEQNNRYKSILYSNGDELVGVVFEIIEKLFNCDLSGFVDKKEEDFIIQKENITFIGEIKGVTSNVKSEHISQLDVHLQTYKDEHDELCNENIKSILIINHQRNKIPSKRDAVHEKQIKLAERNNSLIIESPILLKIYEKFLNQKITTKTIIEKFINLKGLLQVTDI